MKWVQRLVVAALVAWGLTAWWTIRQARHAGAVLVGAIGSQWPEERGPRFDTRIKLLTAAEDIQSGRFGSVASALGPTAAPTPDGRASAQRFFAKMPAQRERFIAAATAAEAQEQDGADVAVVRDALARALAAAAGNDATRVASQIELAEAALAQTDLGSDWGGTAGGAEAVAALVAGIGPAFTLGEELMTEGHAAAEKVVRRASRHYRGGQFREAGWLIQLAAGLMGVELPAARATETPEWFDALAEEPEASVTPAAAEAAVRLCEAMAASESPGEQVTTLVKRSRRELEAGRVSDAHWWATVALNALGMTDKAIAAATDTSQPEGPP